LDHYVLPTISIGYPAIIAGGNPMLFYGAILAAFSASVFAWWYVNHKRKAKKGIGSHLPPLDDKK
jgi:hypothetical protein